MSVLVTGGLGYIGSHTCVELMNAGQDVVVVDNLYNCKKSSYDRIKALVGKDFSFYECDIRDAEGLSKVFEKENITSVIHFAGLKAVGESVHKPLEYFDSNLSDIRHKVVRNTVRVFAHCAALVSTDWVEITKKTD